MRPRSENSGNAIARGEWKAKVFDLRKQGLTYQQIGDQLGVSAAAVCIQVRKAVDELKASQESSIADIRAIEQAKYDDLEHKLKASLADAHDNAKNPLHVAALSGQIIRLYERRARLLGLDVDCSGKAYAELRQSIFQEFKAAIDKVLGGHPDLYRQLIMEMIGTPEEQQAQEPVEAPITIVS